MTPPIQGEPTLPEEVSPHTALRALRFRIDGGEYAWIAERLDLSVPSTKGACDWAGFHASQKVTGDESYTRDIDRLLHDHTEAVLRWVLAAEQRIALDEQSASLASSPDQSDEQKKSTDPGEEIL